MTMRVYADLTNGRGKGDNSGKGGLGAAIVLLIGEETVGEKVAGAGNCQLAGF